MYMNVFMFLIRKKLTMTSTDSYVMNFFSKYSLFLESATSISQKEQKYIVYYLC